MWLRVSKFLASHFLLKKIKIYLEQTLKLSDFTEDPQISKRDSGLKKEQFGSMKLTRVAVYFGEIKSFRETRIFLKHNYTIKQNSESESETEKEK